MAIIAGALSALGPRLKRATVQNHSRGVGSAVSVQAQKEAQIMDYGLKNASRDPALGLLIDGLPRREVVRQHPPGRSTPHDPPEPVKDLAQFVGALRNIFSEKCQIRGDKSPLLVGNIAWIRFAGFHARMQPPSSAEVHNTL